MEFVQQLRAGVWTIAHREIQGFYRQRSRVFGALFPALVLWGLLGAGIGKAFHVSGSSGGYLEFFFPGMLAMSVLFSAIFCNISIIEDRRAGFLQGVLVAPLPEWTWMSGKIIGGAVIGLFQGMVLMVLAPLLYGNLSVLGALNCLGMILALGLALSSVGFCFAWQLNSIQGFHSVMNMVLLPLWVLSGALFPIESAPWVLKILMRVNPLSYGLEGIHSALRGDPIPAENWAILFVFVAMAWGIAIGLAKRPRREVVR